MARIVSQRSIIRSIDADAGKNSARTSSRGNALFLILIAVALFAALSYAITQSGRQSGAGVSRETTSLLAAQIAQTGATLRTAVQRMIILGTPIASIKLHAHAGNAEDNNTPCTDTDGTCLFTPEGGGATFPVTPGNIFSSYGPARYVFIEKDDILDIIVAGIGTPGSEIVMLLPNLSEDVCRALNKGLGIDGIPVLDSNAATLYPVALQFLETPGQHAACLDTSDLGNTPGMYLYYHVLADG